MDTDGEGDGPAPSLNKSKRKLASDDNSCQMMVRFSLFILSEIILKNYKKINLLDEFTRRLIYFKMNLRFSKFRILLI